MIPQRGRSVREVAESAQRDAASDVDPEATPQQGDQIAYAYSYGFKVDAGNLTELQESHRALCKSMGASCRVLSLSKSGNDEHAYGRMELQVAASGAEDFGARLTEQAAELDADQVSFAIAGEDLSEQIVDSEARLEARTALRDRLMGVLRNRQGSVGDLVKAERGVAEVNEEIDATQSNLQNLRNRVAYTSVTIEYDPEMGRYTVGFWAPIANALSAASFRLGTGFAAAIYLVMLLIPFILLFLAIHWIWRRTGFSLFRRKQVDPA